MIFMRIFFLLLMPLHFFCWWSWNSLFLFMEALFFMRVLMMRGRRWWWMRCMLRWRWIMMSFWRSWRRQVLLFWRHVYSMVMRLSPRLLLLFKMLLISCRNRFWASFFSWSRWRIVSLSICLHINLSL